MNAARSTAPNLTAGFHHWQAAGACVGFDPEFFFDLAETMPEVELIAKDVCASCSIREQCLSQAMLAREEHGIWGGLNAEEREAYRPKWQRQNGGRKVVCGLRKRNGIAKLNPTVDNRYSARLKAAQQCRDLVLAAGDFHRKEDYLEVLEMIISYPTHGAERLARKLGFSKAWFNTMKREVFRKFNVCEVYKGEIA